MRLQKKLQLATVFLFLTSAADAHPLCRHVPGLCPDGPADRQQGYTSAADQGGSDPIREES